MKVHALGIILGLLAGLFLGNVHAETGIASFYHEGKWTASGERFNKDAMTCAHRKPMPFNSILRVKLHGRSILCRVNDRGPFVRGRIIDLSRGSARALGLDGVARVTVERVR